MSAMNTYYVYAYLREDGTPYYIGKGKGKRAWQSHRRSNGAQLLPEDLSRITIIKQNLTEQDALALETKLISQLGLKGEGGILVNLTYGGEGRSPGQELREIFRQQQLGRKKPPRTEEHRRKLSESTKGRPRPRTPEHQAALTASLKKNWATNFERKKQQRERVLKTNQEKIISPETREKQRQSMLRYWANRKAQEILNTQKTGNLPSS